MRTNGPHSIPSSCCGWHTRTISRDKSLLQRGRMLSSARGGDNLAQGNASVVRRDPLVPEGLDAFLIQKAHGALREEAVLKTTTGQNHLGFVELGMAISTIMPPGVIEPCGDDARAVSVPHIFPMARIIGSPVDHTRRSFADIAMDRLL